MVQNHFNHNCARYGVRQPAITVERLVWWGVQSLEWQFVFIVYYAGTRIKKPPSVWNYSTPLEQCQVRERVRIEASCTDNSLEIQMPNCASAVIGRCRPLSACLIFLGKASLLVHLHLYLFIDLWS